ncbi:MAG: hypothetical protein OCU22_02645 [Canidatus Methanoxibalbensis ujae]|nr:hypothetical protein [Candidatus Methanoxibalbensis ujae]
MPLYIFGEDARRFLRAQGSNLRINDDFCIEIDEHGEWYVRATKNIVKKMMDKRRSGGGIGEICFIFLQ